MTSAEPDRGPWTSVFDGVGLSGWRAAGDTTSFSVDQGRLVASGAPGTLYHAGNGDQPGFQDFELEATCQASAGAWARLFFHARSQHGPAQDGSPSVLINQAGRALDGRPERCQTGSLYRVRNLFKRWIADDQPFGLRIRHQGRRTQVWVDDMLVVDTIAPLPTGSSRPSGIFGLHWQAEGGRLQIHELRVRPLAVKAEILPAPWDEIDARLARLQALGFPLIDLHLHLKGITLDQVLAHSLRTGINVGIAPNCGLVRGGLPGVTAEAFICDDAGLDRFREGVRGQPVFLGMQAEGRKWVSLFSPQAMRRYDYVFTDCLTFDDPAGRRIRLWIPEEVEIENEQDFMDWYVDKIVGVLGDEPFEVFVNATFLPDRIAPQYDSLWTVERMDRVIEAIVRKGVPVEINARFRIPSAAFIRRAKAAAVRFTFGTNNVDANLGRLEYCLNMIDACELTPEDIYIPRRP